MVHDGDGQTLHETAVDTSTNNHNNTSTPPSYITTPPHATSIAHGNDCRSGASMNSANNKPSLDTGQAGEKGAMRLDTTDVNPVTRRPSHSHSAMSSAPPTPSMRRTSQVPASPIPPDHSPRPAHLLRRSSSSQSLSKQTSTTPQPNRKASRTSLAGTPDGSERRPTPKRSISNLIAGLREAQSTMEPIEEPIPLTAVQIATSHFTKELLGHSSEVSEPETLVILHDACYGHRYSRLKATKTTLSMIVERPERLHASVLGASTAYVRLGGHHAGGKHAPHPEHNHSSTPPFHVRRSARSMSITSPCVTNVHGTSWMSELQQMCHSAPEKLAAGAKELGRDSVPGQPEKSKLHEGDLYLAPESLDAFQGALGGVADAVDAIFTPGAQTKRAFVAVRPPGHHCSADMPSGFCWLNNVHVGIEYAAQTFGLTHAAILDFDLHHGDGSQTITWQRNSKNHEKRANTKPHSKLKLGPDIGYYSIHDINSYPCEMGDDEKVQAASLCIENAHGQSIWNVHLQTWETEADFWKLYEERYSVLFQKARVFLEHHNRRIRAEGKIQPKAAIFLSAGFDASEWEGSGMQRHSVNVPTEFYARFTQDAVKIAESIPSCNGRVISVLEGGYSDRALCTGVLSHLSGLCVSPVTPEIDVVGSLMQQMNSLVIDGFGSEQPLSYDKSWWSAANMTALENKVNPPPPAQAKKGRSGPQPTYATPTESFAYKVVDPQKFARSVSGTMREGQSPATRPPTPPPPEVDWVVATQELSKLLIPTQRQTKSCTPEELAVVRTKQDRQSGLPAASGEQLGQPRQLRDRKAKGPVYTESVHSDETGSVRAISRAESRSSRRETIDVLPSEAPAATTSSRRMSRRLSAGSALGAPAGSVDADAPPVPKLPSTNAAAGVGMKPPAIPVPKAQPVNPKVRAPSKGRPMAASTIPKPVDVDGLTSGLKKVTLKVSTSKEEHDRKQKEKLDAERRARALKGAETRRVNAAAKKAAKEAAAQPTPWPGELPRAAAAAQSESAMINPSPATFLFPSADSDAVDVKTEIPPNHAMHVDSQSTMSSEWPEAKSVHTPDGQAEAPAALHQRVAADTQGDVHDAQSAPAALHQDLPQWANNPRSSSASPALPQDGAYPDGSTASPTSRATSTAPSSSPGVRFQPQDVMIHPSEEHSGKPSVDDLQQSTSSSPPRPASSHRLPVWSSTGPIPFGTNTGAASATAAPLPQTNSEGQSISDVPNTLARTNLLSEDTPKKCP